MSQRNEFQVGEIVDITIKGARVFAVHHSLIVDVPSPHDGVVNGDARVDLPIGWKSVTVERVAPAEWPPRPGDLWRDRHGGLYFAADVHDIEETGTPEIVLIWTHEDYRQTPDQANQNYGPLTLVHREGGDA